MLLPCSLRLSAVYPLTKRRLRPGYVHANSYFCPMKNLIIAILALVFISPPAKAASPSMTSPAENRDTTATIAGVPVNISFPEGKIIGSILVLPGWNFSREDACIKSDLCTLARKSGYCLIKPEMGKSAYLFKVFPETREEWKHYPTLQWVLDTLIPYCQNSMKLLLPGQKNFLFGISTGGRGVALVAVNTGNLFMAGASLSGDFNQLLWTGDKLMTGFLGPYDQFPERWSGRDNPAANAEKLKIPLFIGHGKDDKVVPTEQSVRFYELITSLHPETGHVLHLGDNAGHNYDYWNSEMQRIFAFFYKYCTDQ